MNRIADRKPWTPTTRKINQIRDRIVAEFDPVEIILFGSCARGEAGADSDVDLLVVLDDVGKNYFDTVGNPRNAVGAVGAAVDIIAATPREVAERRHYVNDIIAWAMEDGSLLYERSREPACATAWGA